MKWIKPDNANVSTGKLGAVPYYNIQGKLSTLGFIVEFTLKYDPAVMFVIELIMSFSATFSRLMVLRICCSMGDLHVWKKIIVDHIENGRIESALQ